MTSNNQVAEPRVRFRRVDATLSNRAVEHDSHNSADSLIDPSKLPVYEISVTLGQADNRFDRADYPDRVLIDLGFTSWQASHIIHRADWLWAHGNPDWVDTTLVPEIDDEPAQQEIEFTYGLHVRVVCGHPFRPVKDRSLTSVLSFASRSAALYEIEHDHGKIVHTTNPYQYLVSQGIDPREAGIIIDGATWRWHAGEYR